MACLPWEEGEFSKGVMFYENNRKVKNVHIP